MKSEEKSSFFDNPGRALALFVAVSVVIWTLQCSLLQTILPLDVIETIVWGGQWQMGQFKHPPMSGWVGYVFSAMSGHADWSMYLAAQLSLACGIYFTYRLAREFLPEFKAAAAALLLFVLHYYMRSSMKFCSHFLEIAFLPAMTYYFFLSVKNDRWKDWILFGFFSAIAFLSKYAAAQLFPACLICLCLTKESRARFRSPGLYLSAIVFLLLTAPHVHWLFQHDFAPVLHMQDRMTEAKDPWYTPLAIIGVIVYPVAAQTAALFAAWLPYYKNPVRQKIYRDALIWSGVFTLIPSLIYLFISITGGHVVLMWFSYLASWTGIIAVSVFPFEIDRKVFRNLYVLLCVATVCVFIGTSIDQMRKPRVRHHTRPEDFVEAAQNYWSRHSSEPIPVTAGTRWAAGVIENYAPGRPPTCVLDDPCNLELVRERIDKHGALLFSDHSQEDFANFLQTIGRSAEDWQDVTITGSTVCGKTKQFHFVIGYLPPEKAL